MSKDVSGIFGDEDESIPSKGDARPVDAQRPERDKDAPRGAVIPVVESVEVEAVVKGVLMRVRLRGVAPSDVGDYLRGQDGGVIVRDSFPMKGGPRETKLGRVLVMMVSSTDSGKAIDLVADSVEAGEMKVRVGKKLVDGFLASVRALGRVPEEQMSKMEAVMAGKGSETVMLRKEEHMFGVKYWAMDDGTKFAEGVCLEVPVTSNV